jgi:hypothetical protein
LIQRIQFQTAIENSSFDDKTFIQMARKLFFQSSRKHNTPLGVGPTLVCTDKMLHAVIRSISTKYKAILPLFTTLYHIVNKFHHINPSPRKPDEKKIKYKSYK